MKKFLFAILISLTVFIFGSFFMVQLTPGAAVDAKDTAFEESLALDLRELGLFRGISDTDFDLGRSPTRTEALVMLIRMLGKENEAINGNWTHPFNDVPSWADPYVGYAYEKGITKGVSQINFGADDAAGSNTYLTFMLRILGYSDENGENFTWENPYALATSCGMLPKEVSINEFLRSDMVIVNYAALTSKFKKSNQTLAERLIADNVFTQEQYDKHIDKNVFSNSRAMDFAVSKAIIDHEIRENQDKNRFFTESHVVLELAVDGDIYNISALVAYGDYYFSEEDGKVLSFRPSASCHLASITLLKNENGSFEATNYWSISATDSDPSADISSKFSDAVIGRAETMSSGSNALFAVCDLNAEAYMESDEFRFYPPTYEEALEKIILRDNFTVLEKFTALNGCTVIYGVLTGYPHTPNYDIYLVWQNGKTKQLPLPALNAWGTSAKPDKIYLSDDKSKLHYQVTFDEQMVLDKGLESEKIIHEAGTYNYTADLATGDFDLIITD